ncbi:uncharacterized protein LOC141602856 isoform X2 [Silene latifolia]|uniref:uncharacterized protein LOC141602856 isoform X2 n=2 Tax=Silene latifolia TaxID=37657 RepID=UPI003D76F2CF
MWQLQPSSGKTNSSDQSISDADEEQESPWPQKFVSLAGTLECKKECLGVASQLDLLKGVRQDTSHSSEDEVEAPEFCDQNNLSRQCMVEIASTSLKRDDSIFQSDEELASVQGSKVRVKSVIDRGNLSDTLNQYTRGKGKQIENCPQSAIYKQSTRLDPLTETVRWPTHHPLYLKERNPSKGGRRLAVAGSSHVEPIRGVLCPVKTDKDSNSDSSDELLDETEAIDFSSKEKANHVKDPKDEISKSRLELPVGAVMQLDETRRSMVELLDHLQGNNSTSKPYRKCKTGARRKERIRNHHRVKKKMPLSLNDVTSDEDPGELMNSGSSTESEDIVQNPKPGIVGSEKKTMADKFHEAFGSAPAIDSRPSMAPKLSSSGLFGRLQQVMQWQKEQDAEFLKKQQTEVWPKDEARCIDVKILSRSFDAKLNVCLCSLLENEESSVQDPQHESFQKTWTIIFNARICGDVDLEVGNLIRVHPPWKEVQVLRCGEIIILATYFSQI